MCQSLAPYGATGIDAQSIPMHQVLSFMVVLYAAWTFIKKQHENEKPQRPNHFDKPTGGQAEGLSPGFVTEIYAAAFTAVTA